MLAFGLCASGTSLLAADPVLAAAADSAEFEQWWRFLSRFHLVLLHFPIGFLGLAALFDVYSVFHRSDETRKVVTLTLALTSLSGVVVVALGLMLAQEGGYDEATLFQHQWLGIAVVVLVAAATLLHRSAYRAKGRWRTKLCYRVVLAASVVGVTLAGHQGGNLTHGSQYLVKHTPGLLRGILPEDDRDASLRTAAAGSPQDEFVREILPILERKCAACHGEKKQKGDYRLDVRDSAFGGGDSEEVAIVAGDPFASNLVRVALLPAEHDDAMPPEGKEPLSLEEVVAIVQWIQKGAAYVEPGESTNDVEASEVAMVLPDSADGDADRESPGDDPIVVPLTDDPEKSCEPSPGLSKSTGEAAVVDASGSPGDTVALFSQIRPILEEQCLRCHGAKKRRGKLRLHTWEDVVAGGKNGSVLVPGKPLESSLFTRLAPRREDADTDEDEEDDDDDEIMPPMEKGGPLDAQQIAKIRRWIEAGAHWPENLVLTEGPGPKDPAKGGNS